MQKAFPCPPGSLLYDVNYYIYQAWLSMFVLGASRSGDGGGSALSRHMCSRVDGQVRGGSNGGGRRMHRYRMHRVLLSCCMCTWVIKYSSLPPSARSLGSVITWLFVCFSCPPKGVPISLLYIKIAIVLP